MQPTDAYKSKATTRVIFAEDNPTNAKVTQRLLGFVGLPLDTAVNGLDLLRQMQQKQYDLVLMDISMPEMDGYQACLHIRDGEAGDHHRDVPIIAITALDGDDYAPVCFDMGMNEFVSKPLNIDLLLGKISRYVPVNYPPSTDMK